MSLPHIRVDEVMRTIKATVMIGSVQIRINNSIDTEHDLMSLEMSSIKSFNVIQNPGLRYGDGIGMVINILTKRAERGYTIGGSEFISATTMLNRSSAYAKFNSNNHEFSFDYSYKMSNESDSYYIENDDYTLNDESLYTVTRKDKTDKNKNTNNALTLKYSMAEPEKFNLQIALSGEISDMPYNSKTRTEITQSDVVNLINIENKSHAATPQLDIYLNANLHHRQSIIANAVVSYRKESYNYNHNYSTPYTYDADSRFYSLATEFIYEKQWKSLTLSLGDKYNRFYSNDKYTGDISVNNKLYRSQNYLYSQLSGTFGKFSFKGGIGYDGIRYQHGDKKYNYYQIIPKVLLSYNLCKEINLSYNFQMRQNIPRLVIINDIMTKLNDMEYSKGNPEIKPGKRYEQTVIASLQTKRLQSNLMGMYRMNPDTWMDDISRTDDNKFIYSKKNKGDCNMIYVSDYTTIQIVPNKLEFTLQCSFIRCFNITNSFTHYYSAWMGGVDLQAYIGNFTISAHGDNGWKFMEGENKGHNSGTTYITAGYKLGKWGNLTLMWQNMLDKQYIRQLAWIMNQDVKKSITFYEPYSGNMINIRLSVNISKGRKYRGIKRTMNNSSIESTTVKVN